MDRFRAYVPATGYSINTFEVAGLAPAALTAAPLCEILAGARPILVKMVAFVTTAATASSIGLIRPATVGTATAANQIAGQSAMLTSAPAVATSLAKFGTVWSVAPTISSASPIPYYRRVALPASAGCSVLWEFEEPIEVAASSSLLLWNYGAGTCSACEVSFEFDEKSA